MNTIESTPEIGTPEFDAMLRENGFLGENETFTAVVNKDKKYLKRRKITAAQIADRLETLVQKYYCVFAPWSDKNILASFPPHLNNNPNHNNARCVEGKFIISKSSTSGYHPNPFGAQERVYKGGSTDYLIYNIQNKKLIRFGDLLIELIREKCFFEGNVLYRLSPADVVATLELVPTKELKPLYKCTTRWVPQWRSTSVQRFHYDKYELQQIGDVEYCFCDGSLVVFNATNSVKEIMIEGYPLQLDMRFMKCTLKPQYELILY